MGSSNSQSKDQMHSVFETLNGSSHLVPSSPNRDGASDQRPVQASEPVDPDQALDLSYLFAPNNNNEASTSSIVPTGVGAGLKNLGSSCFLNAIMQCFTHTVPLVKGLLSSTHSVPCDGHNGGFCVMCAFRDHIDHALMYSGSVLRPRDLVNNIKHFSSFFEIGQQEDAHEFMQSALNKLESCILELKKKNDNFADENLVETIFRGQLLSRLKCGDCGHISDTREAFIDLSLEIGNVDSLSSALQSFTMVEKMDAHCARCEEEVSMEKQYMLDQTPSIAALHLKRFNTDGITVEKIDKHIDFPLELDLQAYTENHNEPLKYDLYAVVVHDGFTSTSGHYFCFVRSAPDTWHRMNDSTVTKVSEDYVLSQKAYQLFYARQGTPWFSSILRFPNTSPKSVLDIASTEQDKVVKSKEYSEQEFDYFCQETSESLERNDTFATSPSCQQFLVGSNQEIVISESLEKNDSFAAPPSCKQFPVESNQESVIMHDSKGIQSQVLPKNNTNSSKKRRNEDSSRCKEGNSRQCRENGALGKDNSFQQGVYGFRSLTPPSSPSEADNSFNISRDHLKKNHGSYKKPSNKLAGDLEKQAAMKCIKKMPGPRRDALRGFIDLRN